MSYLTEMRHAGPLHTYMCVFSLIVFTVPVSIVVCQNNPSPVQFSSTQCNEATKIMHTVLEGSCQLQERWDKVWLWVYLSTSQCVLNNNFCVSERYKVIVGNCACVITDSVRV